MLLFSSVVIILLWLVSSLSFGSNRAHVINSIQYSSIELIWSKENRKTEIHISVTLQAIKNQIYGIINS